MQFDVALVQRNLRGIDRFGDRKLVLLDITP